MIPVWRYWLVLLLVPVVAETYAVLHDSPWRFAVIGVYSIIFSLLLTKYTKKLVEVER
jgi:hypothetical protein